MAYTASKGGIEMLTKVAAVELGRYGIRVNCVAPGAIEIERTRREGGDFARIWSAITPLGRIGTPSDVGQAVVYLASADASFVSGQTLWVDGGVFSQARWPVAPMNRRPGPRPMRTASLWVDCRCVLGEGILWSVRRRALLWTDIESARVWQAPHPDGEPRTWALPDRVGCMAECESGEFLLGSTKAISVLLWASCRKAPPPPRLQCTGEARADRGGARGSTHAHQ